MSPLSTCIIVACDLIFGLFSFLIGFVLVVLDDYDGEMTSEREIDFTPDSWF